MSPFHLTRQFSQSNTTETLTMSPRYSVILLSCLLFLGFSIDVGRSFKVPFAVKDVLPVLPREISWPVLNNFHSAVDLLPYYVGSVSPRNGSIEWKGACFFDNEAHLDFTESDREDPGLGGGVLHLTVIFPSLLLFNSISC